MGKTTRALERQEIHKLFDCVDGTRYSARNRVILIVGIGMSLRATELCQLIVSDVLDDNADVKTYVIIRPETAKGNRGRTIRIGQRVREAIADFISYKRTAGESLKADAPLFCSQKGGHLDRTQLFRIVKAILKKAGIDESVHTLRKTGGTHYYIQSGYDIIATQIMLGHADSSTTRRYLNITTEQLEKYSEAFSDFLFDAIENEAETSKRNTFSNLLHFSTGDLLLELQQRGLDISSLLSQRRTQELSESKVVSIDAAKRIL